jgi:hypothetical protein
MQARVVALTRAEQQRKLDAEFAFQSRYLFSACGEMRSAGASIYIEMKWRAVTPRGSQALFDESNQNAPAT